MLPDFSALKLRAAEYEKGERVLSETLSKKQLAELAKRFPDLTLVTASAVEDGTRAVLRNERWEFMTYTLAAGEETIVPERFRDLTVTADLGCGVSMLTEELFAGLQGALNDALEKAGLAVARADKAERRCAQLREQEAARRVRAARAAARNALDAFNASRTEKVPDSCLDTVYADVEKGRYAECADETGVWTGEEEAARAVKALCADAVMEFDRRELAARNAAEAAERAREKNTFIWNKVAESDPDDGGVAGLLSRMGV